MPDNEKMPHDLFDLSGRVAVVLGATSGIGRVLAAGLASAGADVVPTGRRSALVEEAAGEIERLDRRTLAQVCDAGSRESIDRLRDAVLEKFGRVDILLNAAGQIFRKPSQQIGETEWNALLDVNVTGILRACQSFYEPLLASGRGRIVNIASLNSFVALTEVAAYAASKGAVLSLTRSLAVEWAARRNLRQCHRARCFQDRHQRRSARWHRARQGTAAAHAHAPLRQDFGANRCGDLTRLRRRQFHHRPMHRGRRRLSRFGRKSVRFPSRAHSKGETQLFFLRRFSTQPGLFTCRPRPSASAPAGTSSVITLPRGDVAVGADLDRRDQSRVAADERSFADLGGVLLLAVVVAGDGARADVRFRPICASPRYARCWLLAPAPSRVFFSSTKLPMRASASACAPMRRRANGPTCAPRRSANPQSPYRAA